LGIEISDAFAGSIKIFNYFEWCY